MDAPRGVLGLVAGILDPRLLHLVKEPLGDNGIVLSWVQFVMVADHAGIERIL